MKKIIIIVCSIFSLALSAQEKSRVIITTDLGEDPDDQMTLVHTLVMSDQFEIEGIISNTSFQRRPMRLPVIREVIETYGKVLPNLKVHSNDFPSDYYLHSITKYGQAVPGVEGIGIGKDTEGSDLIISVVDDDSDPRPVWLTAWGGMNTIAQAFLTVSSTRSKSQARKFFNKVRIWDCLGQDDAGAWIAKYYPEVLYIRGREIWKWIPDDIWYAENIQSVKPLGDQFPTRKYTWEGDTPAIMYFCNNGLNFPEHMDYGGWGGRYSLDKTENVRGMPKARFYNSEPPYFPYYMHTNTEEGNKAIIMWKDHILNDFKARMLWTVATKYADANHHPKAVLNGDETKQCLEYSVKPGATLEFDASGSSDPDGNNMIFSWMFYKAPSTFKGDVNMKEDGPRLTLHIPKDASGKTIHIILVLTDNGTPNLTSYRRAVISVK